MNLLYKQMLGGYFKNSLKHTLHGPPRKSGISFTDINSESPPDA